MGAIALVAGPLSSAPVTTRSSHGTTAFEIDVVAVDGVTLRQRSTQGGKRHRRSCCGGVRFQGLAANMEYWRTKWVPDAEAAVTALQHQPGVDPTRIAAGGASCGMFLALHVARQHQKMIAAVLALAGPIDAATKAFIAGHDGPPVLGVASEEDGPAPAWVRELVAGSTHRLSRAVVFRAAGHGTEMLAREAATVPLIVDWFGRPLPLE